MKRRDFLKNSTFALLTAGASATYGKLLKYQNSNLEKETSGYDLVVVKGGEPDILFDKAIETLGGINKYIKKGQRVVIKPNICWDAPPERAANTNPKLIGRIVEHCFKAGAKEVLVFDHTGDDWEDTYKNSGIEKAAVAAGAKMLPGNDEDFYREVSIEKGKRLLKAKVHECILNSDTLINVPVLKHHGGMQVSIAMKNLMGVVWDRAYWHKNDLHQCIVDFASFCKPVLNIVDAYNVMTKNGPRGVSVKDVVNMKSLIVSSDIVAADAIAAKLFGVDPEKLNYLKIAYETGLGEMNTDKLSIKNIVL